MSKRPPGLLVFFHCSANTGYAIRSLEATFFDMALRLVGGTEHVHFAYTDYDQGQPDALPPDFTNLLEFDPHTRNGPERAGLQDYVRRHGIRMAFGFDQSPQAPCMRLLRDAGVRRIVSYWGAPMSSLNRGLKLRLRRLDVMMRRHAPDHYIFESKAMARTATHGRGVPATKVSVVYLGVDTDNPHEHARMAARARQRVLRSLSRDTQLTKLTEVCSGVFTLDLLDVPPSGEAALAGGGIGLR